MDNAGGHRLVGRGRRRGGAGGAISSRQEGGVPTSLTVVDSSFIGNRAGDGGDRGPSGGNGGVGGRGGAIEAQGGTAAISGTTFSGNLAGDGGDGVAGAMTRARAASGGDGGAIYAAFGTLDDHHEHLRGEPRRGRRAHERQPGDARQGRRRGRLDVEFERASARAPSTRPSPATCAGPRPSPTPRTASVGGRVASSILADAAPACQNVTAGPLRNVALPGDPSCAGPRLDGDPRLGPLAANGGPTLTLAPGPGSAAVNALAGSACPAIDQRGLPRPRLGGCDAGAVEVQPPPASRRASRRRDGLGTAAKARRLSALRLSPAAFRAARAGGSIGALTKALQQRRPIGATVRYTPGRRRAGDLHHHQAAAGAPQGQALRQAGRRQARRQALPAHEQLKGSFAHQGVAGQNSFRFTGRLRRKALAPGRYSLVARLPRPATGRSRWPPRPSASSADGARARC